MRRTIAGTAVSLLAALAIGGPFGAAGHAAPATVQCAGADSPECALLDDLASQLGPIAPLLGTVLAPLADQAEGLAARSEQSAGVPTAEVVAVSEDLLGQLGSLSPAVQTLIGGAQLGALTDTLETLVAELTAPVSGAPQSSGGSPATPAKTAPSPTASVGAPRASDGSGSVGAPAPAGGSTSSAAVPNVPVGDPLALAPLGLPDFAFDPSFAPAADVEAPAAEVLEAAASDALGGGGRPAEVAVVAVLSALLLAGAGVAQLQANRHHIED